MRNADSASFLLFGDDHTGTGIVTPGLLFDLGAAAQCTAGNRGKITAFDTASGISAVNSDQLFSGVVTVIGPFPFGTMPSDNFFYRAAKVFPTVCEIRFCCRIEKKFILGEKLFFIDLFI